MRIDFLFFEISLNRNPLRIMVKLSSKPIAFRKDYVKFKSMASDDDYFPIKANNPQLDDKEDEAGNIKSTYFIQDLYVAQKIYENKPIKHVDIGSRIDGLVAHVATFRNIEVFDIRRMESTIKNVLFRQADLTDEETITYNYCDSVSCLHALEHFGLGRYGDKLDPIGHKKGFDNITKMLQPGGTFYFSVPMGKQRIEFNAHRVFGLQYLLDWVKKDYDIKSFAYISDDKTLYENVMVTQDLILSDCGCNLGCAIFELKKK